MLHEIKIKKEFNYSHMESDIIKKISKEKFFGELQEHNLNIHHLISNYKKDLNYVAKFNFFLRVVKQNHQIAVHESILFLEDDGYDMKKLVPLLNSDIKNEIELELNEKYKLKKKNISSVIDNYFIF